MDGNGNDLPGWEGGKATGGSAVGSPAIGDIAGDSRPEIVVPVNDKMLYAWHADGTPVAGFPMKPTDHQGKSTMPFYFNTSVALADYDGDPQMEIIVNRSWSVAVVDGNGQQLSTKDYHLDGWPAYYADGTLINSPAADDIDGDGKLEIVVSTSKVTVWDVDSGVWPADWPQFKYDAERTSFACSPRLAASPDAITVAHTVGDPGPARSQLTIRNECATSFEWRTSTPGGVSVSPTSGVLNSGESRQIEISINTNGKGKGIYELGNLTVLAEMDGTQVTNSPSATSITLIVVATEKVQLPVIAR